jgi:hypothetical protein
MKKSLDVTRTLTFKLDVGTNSQISLATVVIGLLELLTFTEYNQQNSKGQVTGEMMTTLVSFRCGSNDFIF